MTFRCHSCARKIETPDKYIRHVVKCPSCQAVNVVPDPKKPTEFARRKEAEELKKILDIFQRGEINEKEFETVKAKVYEMPWGAPPEAVPKQDMKDASPTFGGAAGDADKKRKEEEEFRAFLAKAGAGSATGGDELTSAANFGGVTFQCKHCGAKIGAPLNMIGLEHTCPECHQVNVVPKPGEEEPAPAPPEPSSQAEPIAMSVYGSEERRYKVVTSGDEEFAGRFDPATIEKVINLYASRGWKLNTAASADFRAGRGLELVLIMERMNLA